MLRIVIPARLASSRLQDKMIQRIGTKTLVEHAVDRVLEAAGDTEVVLATDSDMVSRYVADRVRVVSTQANCRSGSDRCAAVADICGWVSDDIVVNVQADMPFLRPSYLQGFLKIAAAGGVWDVLTAFADVSTVDLLVDDFRRRTTPCHVGLYAFTRNALRRFAALPTSPREEEFKLEQLRAVEHGFRIAYHAFPEMPFEVNTPQDLAAAQWMATCVAAA